MLIVSAECLFCKIVAKEIPSEIVYETESILAFTDINPVAPVHILIIPKKHIVDLGEVTDDDSDLIFDITKAVQKLVQKYSLTGYRLVNNCGSSAGQTVAHLHFHLLAGRDMRWPPG